MKSRILAIAAGVLLLAAPQSSRASLMLSVSDGTTTDFVSDSGGTGAISFSGAIGAFSNVFVNGVSKPVVGTAEWPVLDLNALAAIGRDSPGGTLTLELTDTGFLGWGSLAELIDLVGGTLRAGSLSVTTYMDCSNTAFGLATKLTSLSFGAGAYSNGAYGPAAACSGPYSLTQVATIELGRGGLISFDSELALPEPATVGLFGLGLLGFAAAGRRIRAA